MEDDVFSSSLLYLHAHARLEIDMVAVFQKFASTETLNPRTIHPSILVSAS